MHGSHLQTPKVGIKRSELFPNVHDIAQLSAGNFFCFSCFRPERLQLDGSSPLLNGMGTPSSTYQVAADADGQIFDVTISEPPREPILGLSTWSSSLVIANILHKIDIGSPPPDQKRARILEIGAGTGLAGLAACLLWKQDCVLTDIAAVVDNLSRSVSLNAKAVKEAKVSANAATLDWNEPDELLLSGVERKTPDNYGKFDVLIAADVVYDEYHPELLVNVVRSWLTREPHAKFFLGYPLRVMNLEWIRDIWKRLEKTGLRVLEEGTVSIGEEWDDERLLEWVVWKWEEGNTYTNGASANGLLTKATLDFQDLQRPQLLDILNGDDFDAISLNGDNNSDLPGQRCNATHDDGGND